MLSMITWRVCVRARACNSFKWPFITTLKCHVLEELKLYIIGIMIIIMLL